MNDPQIWTIIGVFAAALFGMLTFMSQSFMRSLSAHTAQITTKVEVVEAKLQSRMDAFDARLDVFDARLETFDARIDALSTEMGVRFERLETRVDNLDRDVQAIAKKVFEE
ncbi:hypothetical protein D1J51_03635 [Leucobacter sp. wl10]|nr:hypothetical protein D1J51_03635 [Leucobacter sp. wl10]